VKKILCIEDDRETAQLISEELTERGFEVALAWDGHEGVIAMLKGGADLVLCDSDLKSMSGFEVLELFGDLARRIGSPPFVFMTSVPHRDEELNARRLGADDYVTKPIDFEILEIIIKARLAGVARKQSWPRLVELTEREIEVLTWVARGKSSAQIAAMIGLAKRTVDYHLENARAKLGTRTRIEAATKAAIGQLIVP
jgi:DNA-binding NarL/FixJ family response regulator